jgi:N,N'-diacetylchitobiose phosphorylase
MPGRETVRYGHFDDENYEYVIERPDTPRSWSNYFGTREYGGVITNNAGGYSFYQSSALGRFLRLQFNAIPMDQPGRYFYLYDRESDDYWSASWQPVGKPLDEYRSTCRFGTSYTIIESAYSGIRTEATYFVPLEQHFEYWRLKVSNVGKRTRRLSLFTYCEFVSEWNIFQDGFNLQYSAYIVRADWRDGMVRCSSLGNLPPDPEDFAKGDQGRWWWMALVGGEVAGYDLDREAFIGPYRGYHNPLAVERGYCSGSTAYSGNACGGLQVDVALEPGETRELLVLLGVGRAEEEGAKARAEFGSPERAAQELEKVKREWHGRLGKFVVDSPDEDLDHMVNVWNAYNALITFYWSRSASLVYTGDQRDGYGYRDTVQDILGVLPSIPGEARERLDLMITGQESNGGARPEVKPFAHWPGRMEPTPPEQVRADDALWLFNSVPAYVAETGDVDFYDKVLPYSDEGEDTVLGHLRRALEFTLERNGAQGLPAGLRADWNDCLKLGYRGESLFVAFQLRYGLVVYASVARLLKRSAEVAWAEAELERLDAAIQAHGWDGAWFVRAYREDGSVIGSSQNGEGSIFLNPQSWAVLSGAATEGQARSAMDAVEEHLATVYGLVLCAPPFKEVDYHVVRAVLFNPGEKENGSIFSHTQSWAVMADCLLGNGDRAYRHYRAYMPARFNDRPETREIEPYVHCQSTSSKFSHRPGMSHIPWLSGTASWSSFAATQYILGIRPEVEGLRIDPCIPSGWEAFSVRRAFRGKVLNIKVQNPTGVQKGVSKVVLNREEIEGNLIPVDRMRDENDVTVMLGDHPAPKLGDYSIQIGENPCL